MVSCDAKWWANWTKNAHDQWSSPNMYNYLKKCASKRPISLFDAVVCTMRSLRLGKYECAVCVCVCVGEAEHFIHVRWQKQNKRSHDGQITWLKVRRDKWSCRVNICSGSYWAFSRPHKGFNTSPINTLQWLMDHSGLNYRFDFLYTVWWGN